MAKTVAQLPAALVKTKVEGTKMLTPLEKEVSGLQVVTPEQYQEADHLLAAIIQKRAEWKGKLYGTPAKPGPITIQRAALESMYALNRDIDGPLETLEKAVRRRMIEYKTEEARQLQEAERERQRREEEARQALEQAAERAAQARTAKGKATAEAALDQAIAAVEEVETEDTPAPVVAQGTGARTVKKWRVKDLIAVIAGVVDGAIDTEALMIDSGWVNHAIQMGADVSKWPGFEVYEEIQIVRRRS